MAEQGAETLIASLVEAVPALGSIVHEHVADNGELLPHVLFGDLTRFIATAEAQGDHTTVQKCLDLLDRSLESPDPYVVNLVSVSFVENIGPWDPEMAPFIARWPERLRSEAKRQTDWRPGR